ncbi:ankyrin [Cenococcum geophilum 1.58]|uniref:ankyrin n=1 Tax=Cenococcum geophilum 1.58 TaxID=794803 RepID=UPI00358EA978|nr:ankyrin [Cenococcum geophilum 1.58]
MTVKDIETLNLGTRLLKGTRPYLEDRLIEILTLRAQGMFRWVELQLAAFLGPNSKMELSIEVTKKLDRLEKETGDPDLDKVYAEIYDMNTKPKSDARAVATRAFKWMMCAQRPLQIIELAKAASIDDDGIPNNEVNEQSILMICSNFIIVDTSGIAQFAHLSVREYLEKRKTDEIKEYSSELAHTQVAVTCLECLNNPQIHISDIREFKAGLPGYSVLHWAMHCEMASVNRGSGRLGRLFAKFWAPGKAKFPFIDWVGILPQAIESYLLWEPLPTEKRLRDTISSSPNPFFAACVWGFSEVIGDSPATIIANLTKLNGQGNLGLSIASENGHCEVARLLVKSGANVKAKDQDGRTALHLAAWGGHEAVVHLLIESGADVEEEDHDRRRALHRAAGGGHEAVARLLVESKANIEAKDQDGWTALHRAAGGGHESVVQLLVESGVVVEAKDHRKWSQRRGKGSDGRTALHLAAWGGHEAVVRLLVEIMADVKARNQYEYTALHLAALGGHNTVVRLLTLTPDS